MPVDAHTGSPSSSTSSASTFPASAQPYASSHPSDSLSSSNAFSLSKRASTYRQASMSSASGPFANQSSSSVPPSPTSSTASSSYRSFFSTALPPFSEPERYTDLYDGPVSTVNLDEDGDLGDRTITQSNSSSPQQRKLPNGKGKGRAGDKDSSTGRDYSSDAHYQDYDGQLVGDDDEAESKRIEENLRNWAAKEKLRRAKTRNRHPSVPAPQPPAIVSDGIAAVSDLARRVSRQSGGRRQNSGESRSGSMSTDVVELQSTSHASRSLSPQRQWASPTGTLSPPNSATSANFPGRVERAVKTGSRFIEDLEDQEMLPISMHNPPASYAQLNSASSTPLTSPSKSNLRSPRSKLRLKLTDNRTNSLASVISFHSYDSKETINGATMASNPFAGSIRTPSPSLKSPIGPVPPEYYMHGDESRTRLVSSPRGIVRNPFKRHNDSERLDDRLDPDEDQLQNDYLQPRRMSFLEWVFCCGCFAAPVSLDEYEEQAGRTFPE